jgi:hypothetical protein
MCCESLMWPRTCMVSKARGLAGVSSRYNELLILHNILLPATTQSFFLVSLSASHEFHLCVYTIQLTVISFKRTSSRHISILSSSLY